MPIVKRYADLPVLLLHNVDPAWAPVHIEDAFKRAAGLESALRELGHPVENVPVYDDNMFLALRGYEANEWIVFNWCEELPGFPRSEALVVQILDALNFTYTGSPAPVLVLGSEKDKVKRLLERNEIPTPRWDLYESSQPEGWNRYPVIVKPAKEHCSIA